LYTRPVIRDALTLKLLIGALASLACLGLAEIVLKATQASSVAVLLRAGSISVFVWSLSEFSKYLLQGARSLYLIGSVYLVEGVAKILFAPLLTLRFGMVGATWGMSIAYAIGAAAGLAAVLGGVYRHASPANTAATDRSFVSSILKYAAPILLASGAAYVFSELGSLFLGVLSTPEQVGHYSVANNFARSLILVAGLVSMIVGPMFAQIRVTRPETLSRMFDKTTQLYLFLLGLLCALLFGLSAPLVVVVFGPDHLSAVPILRVLLFGGLVIASSQLYSSILDYFGQARLRSTVLLATTVLYLVLTITLIPILDGIGAATAILLSFFPYTLYVLVHAGSLCGARPVKAVLSMFVTMATGLAAGLIATRVPSTNVVLAGIVTSIGVYSLLTLPIQFIRLRGTGVRA
jgi:O-antigen/teichoic acid export membrane protein